MTPVHFAFCGLAVRAALGAAPSAEQLAKAHEHVAVRLERAVAAERQWQAKGDAPRAQDGRLLADALRTLERELGQALAAEGAADQTEAAAVRAVTTKERERAILEEAVLRLGRLRAEQR
jgi:hypothetical protein